MDKSKIIGGLSLFDRILTCFCCGFLALSVSKCSISFSNVSILQEYSEAVSQLKSCVSDDSLLIHDAMDIPDVNSAVEKLIKSTSMLNISIESVLKYPEVEAAEVQDLYLHLFTKFAWRLFIPSL